MRGGPFVNKPACAITPTLRAARRGLTAPQAPHAPIRSPELQRELGVTERSGDEVGHLSVQLHN